MVATGGAGPVHVVEVARKLRIPRVLATIAAGAGSCLGLLALTARVDRSWSNPALVAEIDWRKVAAAYAELPRADAEEELASAGANAVGLKWWIGTEMRYAGQGHNVSVMLPWRQVSAAMAPALVREFETALSPVFTGTWCRAQHPGHHVAADRALVVKHHRFAWGDARVAPSPSCAASARSTCRCSGASPGAGLRPLFAEARHAH